MDSRVILTRPGQDRLLGRRHVLHVARGNRLIRAQGCWVSDSEIAELVRFWKKASVDAPEYDHLVQMQLWSSDGAAAEDEEMTCWSRPSR